MTSDQLRYFTTIVDTGGFMTAAMELNISQSSISKQIQALEAELGVFLFDRSSRKAKLTQEGLELLPEARSVLSKMDHLMYSASKLQPGYSKRITIATLPFIGHLGLYASLSRFELENPDYHLTFVEEEEPQLIRRMTYGNFDLIITYEYEYNLTDITSEFLPITTDEVMVLINHENPLSKLGKITLSDIGDTPILMMEPYTCISKICTDYFRDRNFSPNITMRGRPETIFGSVEANRGIALLTRKQVRSYTATESVALPLSPALSVTIGAVITSDESRKSAVKNLIGVLKTNF
jgi:DNA-binding transcriptional LysR family regulator